MDRRPDWLVLNGALAAALYFAIVVQIPSLQYAITAFAWWTLAGSLAALFGDPRSRPLALPAIGQVQSMVFELAVLAAMFAAHWYWTACAYAATCGCAALIRERAAGKR